MEYSNLVTQSRNLGLFGSAGLKRRADQRNKCDENRTHLESDDNLTNGRNVCVISPQQTLVSLVVAAVEAVEKWKALLAFQAERLFHGPLYVVPTGWC